MRIAAIVLLVAVGCGGDDFRCAYDVDGNPLVLTCGGDAEAGDVTQCIPPGGRGAFAVVVESRCGEAAYPFGRCYVGEPACPADTTLTCVNVLAPVEAFDCADLLARCSDAGEAECLFPRDASGNFTGELRALD